MRIRIDDLASASAGRIQEIEEGEEVESCFLCDGVPVETVTLTPDSEGDDVIKVQISQNSPIKSLVEKLFGFF